MKPEYRLKKKYQYDYVFKHSKSVLDKKFVVMYCTSKYPQTKVGFAISKKYGHAVERNRLRRQLKSAVRGLVPSLAEGFNIVVVPRRHSEYTFDEIVSSLTELFGQANIVK